MKKPNRQILRDADLLQALKFMSPSHKIKMMIETEVFHIDVKAAILIVRTSPFEGDYRHGRIYKIRSVDSRRSNKHDHRFRDGRACLQSYSVTRKTVDLWDKCFASLQPVQTP